MITLYPSLYQVNTRVLVRARPSAPGRLATLDDIPDADLKRMAALGFDWVWFLGVWRTGDAGRRVALRHADWRRPFLEALPDLDDHDICGSCFAITAYEVHPDLGGTAALRRLRERMHQRGLRLMLDFVPNHVAVDHPWVRRNPDMVVQGSEADLARAPQDYTRVETERGPRIVAHGRDPHLPGWPDTVQVNHGNPAAQRAMREQLLAVAELCDGVRCDMAMLILPEVFQRTWGIAIAPFWPEAIRAVRDRHPDFRLLAEVYWGLEWTLQQQGFDYTYDKTLYDRLFARAAGPVRDHLRADLAFQNRLVRFLENHDEPRAASLYPWDVHQAAAVVCFLAPGLRFFHEGQLEGRVKRLPIHLSRAEAASPDPAVQGFYERLLELLRRPVFRSGAWRLLDAVEAWQGNGSREGFIAFLWTGDDGARWVVAVNYQPHRGQCRLPLPCPELAGRRALLVDALGLARYDRDGDALLSPGLFLDMPAWGYHAFEVRYPGPARQV